MTMHLASSDAVRDDVIEAPQRVVGVNRAAELWRDLRALVVENRLRAPFTGAHLVHKKLWVWEGWPSEVPGHAELRINGVPWVLPPVERFEPDPRAARQVLADTVDNNPAFIPFEGYCLEVSASGDGLLHPGGWAVADRRSDLVDESRGRRGVPVGCAYIGIPLAARALRPPASPEPARQVADLGLNPRTVRALHRGDVHTVQQLVALSHRELVSLPGIGSKAVTEVDAALAEHGLQLPARGR